MKPNQLRKLKFEDLILHEDDSFIIINKPPYVSTLEDRNTHINILALARAYWSEAKTCHRLDKETSGLLVIAKSEDSYKYFSSLLENRDVTKVYHAIVEGRHEIDELELDSPIFTTTNKSRVDFRRGKPSITLVSSIDIYKHHTLLACMPFTGRMHQIRLHLSDAEMPIIGDESYGGQPLLLSRIKKKYNKPVDEEERSLLPRVALHAAGLSFPLENGETFKIQAPYPKDFAVALTQLEKNRR